MAFFGIDEINDSSNFNSIRIKDVVENEDINSLETLLRVAKTKVGSTKNFLVDNAKDLYFSIVNKFDDKSNSCDENILIKYALFNLSKQFIEFDSEFRNYAKNYAKDLLSYLQKIPIDERKKCYDEYDLDCSLYLGI